MFVQHMLAVLKADGKMATIMPHGVLFRGGEEKEARKHFLERGWLEEKKIVPDPKVGEKDVSELQVEDTVRKSKFALIVGTETNLADYEASFESRLKVQEPVKAMKGDNFRIPSWPDTTYKVIDIQEDSAVISPLNTQSGQPEKQIVIKKS